MSDADYLRRQAENCLNLSRATFDLVIASRLRALAEDLQRKAGEIDGARFPLHVFERSASPNGDRDRT
jgi:hypothetical protein